MLSGEVGFFNGTMQLTHPGVLDPGGVRSGQGQPVTGEDRRDVPRDRRRGACCRRSSGTTSPSIRPRPRCRAGTSTPASARSSTCWIPSTIRYPKSVRREWGLISEDEAVRAIHLAERPDDRERARERLAFDEAIGLQWALVARRHRDPERDRSVLHPRFRTTGWQTALGRQLPFELTAGQRDVLDVLSTELADTRPMHRMLQGEVGSGKTIVSVLAMAQMVDAGYQCALLAPTEVLAAAARAVHSRRARSPGDGGSTRRPRTTRPGWHCSPARCRLPRSVRSATRSPPVTRASSSAPTRCSKMPSTSTTSAWWSSTNNTGSASNSGIDCEPRPLVALPRICSS